VTILCRAAEECKEKEIRRSKLTVGSIWKGDPINFSLPLIAFQNGFFWQVVFSKGVIGR